MKLHYQNAVKNTCNTVYHYSYREKNLSLKKYLSVRKIFILVIILFTAQLSFSQADSAKPVYLRFPSIPQFTIYKASDSTKFTREDLQKNKSTVFIMFSPDCEHCQHETKALIENIDKFKKAQIVMVEYLSFEQMVKFYKDYKIENYPNIIMGRDAKFFLPIFFKVESLPAIYVYDKKGKFKKAFSGSVKMDKIAAEL